MNLTQGQSSSYGYTSGTSATNAYTNGTAATLASNAQAATANAQAYSNWREAAEFNALEAQKQREWQEYMASTAYQRTVKDLKAAGINPILAAQNGATATGSGASANLATANSFMGSAYADTISSGQSATYGENWSNSDSGLLTFISGITEIAKGLYEQINSSSKVSQGIEKVKEYNSNLASEIVKRVGNKLEYGADMAFITNNLINKKNK